MKIKPEKRFWKYVKKTDYCWLWTGALGGTMGYGNFWNPPKPIYAHRFSWILHCGKIPKGKQICHKCDKPSCVNPKHLFVGTQLENIRDMYKKGRGNNGEKNGQAKLRDKDVERILKLFKYKILNDAEIAMAFSISPETIRLIRHKKRWNHINHDYRYKYTRPFHRRYSR